MSLNASTSAQTGLQASGLAVEENGGLRHALIAGGIAVAVGAAGYYYYKKTHPDDSKNNSAPKDPTALAEMRKNQGIEAFRQRDYQGALKAFKLAVEALPTHPSKDSKTQESKECVKAKIDLLSNCYNNIAACYENMGDYDQCVEFCSLAIELNSKYWKALNRRARAFVKQNKLREALGDYIEALEIKNLTNEQINQMYEDRERVSLQIIKPEIDATLEQITNTYKPIPQYVIANWIWYSVTKDPLVLRAEKLNPKAIYDGLDSALVLLKRSEYDHVLPVTIGFLEDDSIGLMEKAKGVVLAARLLHLHNQTADAREFVKKFEAVWEGIAILDEELKADSKDLEVAYFSLLVSIAENNDQAESYVEKSLAIDPENADPLVTLGLRFMEQEAENQALLAFRKGLMIDPAHPYIKFYVLYLNFVDACKNQRINEVHNCIYMFDQALKDDPSPPVFALLLFVKVCILSNNGELALETAKKAVVSQPNNAYALSLHALVATEPTEKIELCLDRLQRNMEKVVEADPNYWEPYRTLARMSLERAKSVESEKNKVMPYYEKAVALARRREEFDILLKDKLWAEIELEHREKVKNAKAGQSGSPSK